MDGKRFEIDLALIRSVTNMMNDSFLVLDHDLNVLFANESFYRKFELAPAPSGKRNLLEMGVGRMDLPGLREFLEQTKAQTSDCANLELESSVPGVGRMSLSLTARCISFTGDRCALILLSIHDMTEWLRTLKSLQDSEKRFAHFVEGIPLGVFIVDSDGTPCYENQVFTSLVGKGLEKVKAELQDSTLLEVIGAHHASTGQPYPIERDPLGRALSGVGTSVNDMVIKKDDRAVFLEVTGAPIYNDKGDIAYAVAIYKDITISRSHGGTKVKKVVRTSTE